MSDVLGMGLSHYPAALVPDKYRGWPLARFLRDGTVIPEHRRDPATWPEEMRVEWGNDEGESAHARHREKMFTAFRELRRALDDFAPDFVLIFADDQYENFTETVVPPFCVMAFDDIAYQPLVRMKSRAAENIFGVPHDHTFRVPGCHMEGRALTAGLIDRGFDMAYAYVPMHKQGLGHGFANTLLYLDLDQQGFDYPVLPVAINCYGSNLIRERGAAGVAGERRFPDAPDPPSPSPKRCFDLGHATAQVIKENGWRVAVVGSSSWSHAFLTPKNDFLYPDHESDLKLLKALKAGDYDVWTGMSTADIEDGGLQEVLNWHCLVGAMAELDQKMELVAWADSWCFNANKCMALFR